MNARRLWLHLLFAWLVVATITSWPYLYGLLNYQSSNINHQPSHFIGFTHNIDDACVYLTWINQARDGHFFIQNLYTTEPQRLLPFNVLFLAMGLFSRITSISPTLTFHLWRILLIPVLFLAISRLCKALEREQLAPAAIWLAALSSGLGWLLNFGRSINRPVDLWQPEAITFLSAYLNPLFLASMALMIWALVGLLKSVKSGSVAPALQAGIALLLLANIHTYDLVTIALTWAAYTIVLLYLNRTEAWRALKYGFVAAAFALPTLAYQLFLYLREPVYRLRAETPAESPAIWFFLIGYGLLLIFAAIGAAGGIRKKDRMTVFLVLWALAGFAAVYLPMAQQRKLIMGTHIPLCILAAAALVPAIARSRSVRPTLLWLLALVAMFPSNRAFLCDDVLLLRQHETAPNFPAALSDDETQVLKWLSHNAKPDDMVLAPPALALFIPPLTGKRVYYGHWSETVDYRDKLNEWIRFADVSASQAERARFLHGSRVRFVVQDLQPMLVGMRILGGPLPSNVGREVFRSGHLAIYRVSER